MSIYFLTFGDSNRYGSALQRCEKQAKEFGIFSDVYAVDENDLIKNFSSFWERHKDFMLGNKRGFGYWIWKSYLISELLENVPKDSIIFYMDSGCQLNIKALDRFTEYCDYTMDHGGLAFRLNLPELEWTKSDTYHRICGELTNDINELQHVGGINFFKNTSNTIDLVKEWQQICSEDNYHYIDDSPSVKPNHNIFKEHRHDQSIFSLLVKKYNHFCVLNDETYWAPDWKNLGKEYPIWAVRNSSLNVVY
jgi:hypothetical protein